MLVTKEKRTWNPIVGKVCTLEVCAMIALKNHKISEVVLTSLDAMINDIRKGEISQIVRVIR